MLCKLSYSVSIMLLFIAGTSIDTQAAPRLYGITFDGKILEISEVNASSILRADIPSKFSNEVAAGLTEFESIEYCVDKFYVSYDGGKILSVDTIGNVSILFDTGVPKIEGMSCHNRKIYVSYSSNTDNTSSSNDRFSETVGELDLSNGTITPKWEPNSVNNVNFEALTSLNGANLIAQMSSAGGGTCGGQEVFEISENEQLPTKYDIYSDVSLVPPKLFSSLRHFHGMVVDRDIFDSGTGYNRIYGVRGLSFDGYNKMASTSTLYRAVAFASGVNCPNNDAIVIGTISYDGVSGLSWGPLWGTDPENLAWEPIRQLLQ